MPSRLAKIEYWAGLPCSRYQGACYRSGPLVGHEHEMIAGQKLVRASHRDMRRTTERPSAELLEKSVPLQPEPTVRITPLVATIMPFKRAAR